MRNLKDKFSALFHDPLDKPLSIFSKEKHEDVARDLAEELHIRWEITDNVRMADNISSSMERMFITEGMKVNFKESPQAGHPLDGNTKELTEAKGRIEEEIKSTIIETFKKLSEFPHWGEYTSEFYIFLWAYMKKGIVEEGKGLEEFWEKVPADTRIPDHSIWDHLFSTSAIVGALPKPSFLILSITPVQKFISQARKTRDFWIGSYILSWLAWKAIEVIIEEYGPDAIIFPELHEQPFVKAWLIEKYSNLNNKEGIKRFLEDDKRALKRELLFPTIPNRFVALVNFEDGNKIASKAEEAVRKEFSNISNSVKNKLKDFADDTFNRIWERQINNYFDIIWSIVPFRLDGEKLKGTREEVEEVIDRIKNFYLNIPDFAGAIIETYKKWKQNLQYPENLGFLYPVIYDVAERIAGAEKGLRTKKGVEEKGFKCTLCGEREALHPEGVFKWKELNEFWKSLRESLNSFGPVLREDEKLCAVCLTKRLAGFYFEDKFQNLTENFSNSFPSTADMAVFTFKKKVLEKAKKNEKLKKAVENFIKEIEKIKDRGEISKEMGVNLTYVKNPALYELLNNVSKDDPLYKFAALDGDWLFEERYFSKSKKEKLPEEILEVLNAARKQLKKIKEGLKGSPSKYYAIIKLDGDSMGEVLKGEKNSPAFEHYHPEVQKDIPDKMRDDLLKIKRPISIPVHRAISSALRNYSLRLVPKIVESAGGKVVFSGGDDVFALLPLENLLPTVEKLRAAFSGEVKWSEIDKTQGYLIGESTEWVWDGKRYILTMGNSASASVGVAIVHWEWPLSMAINEAARAEEEAKKICYNNTDNNDGRKNAFVLSFVRRSGAKRKAAFKFYIKNGKRKNWIIHDALLKIQKLFEEEKLSTSTAYNLSQVFKNSLDREPDKEFLKVFKTEFIRIAKRGLKREEKEEVEKELKKIFENFNDGEGFFAENIKLKNFTDALEILAFLAKGGEE